MLDMLEQEYFTGSRPLVTPNHSFRTCGGPETFTSATIWLHQFYFLTTNGFLPQFPRNVVKKHLWGRNATSWKPTSNTLPNERSNKASMRIAFSTALTYIWYINYLTKSSEAYRWAVGGDVKRPDVQLVLQQSTTNHNHVISAVRHQNSVSRRQPKSSLRY